MSKADGGEGVAVAGHAQHTIRRPRCVAATSR
jgi:hypothetical protein